MFGNYSQFLEYTNNNKLLSASLTGVIGAFMITPFDYFKIHRQTNSIAALNKINKINKSNARMTIYNLPIIYNGLWITICRESIAIPAYFLTFDIMHYQWNYPAFISGGIAGVNSWLFTYPIDTLKTRRQLYPDKTFQSLIQMGKLYNGLGITLLRAVIVNGVNFQLYTILKKQIQEISFN
jgi:solute carrier family 25 carnitine/acylcarnitine transporter 20/29